MSRLVILNGVHGDIAVDPEDVAIVEPASAEENKEQGFFDENERPRQLTRVVLKSKDHPRFIYEAVYDAIQKLNG